MNSILTLLKLDIKSKMGVGKKFTKNYIISMIINLFFTAIIYTVFVVGIYFIAKIMTTGSVPLRYEFLVIATGIGMIVLFVVCTGNLVKNLYYDGDNELLLRFPVDGNQIFAAKAIYVFIVNLVVAYALMLPIYIIFGTLTSAKVSYYFWSVAVVALIALLPFCLANLVALPVINMTNLLKNRFALLLALMILIVVFGFAFYMLILKGVLEYASNKSPGLLTEDVRSTIASLTSNLIPFNFYANILLNSEKRLTSFLIIVGITAIFAVAAFYISKKSVYRIVLKNIERESEAYEYKVKDKVTPVFAALLRKEYILIFRSFSYSFQYLAMAITAPVMVYFCNDLASSIGDASVGGRIIPGLTMLVVLIFVTIIISFSSTSISREGNTFYLTKIMPVSYRFQILVKLTLYFVVATASVLLSCIVVFAVFGGERYGNNVRFSDIIAIFFIAEFIIISLTCSAIKKDIKNPTFEVSKSGDLVDANKNISTNILGGVVIAVLFGLITMIFSYIPLSLFNITVIDSTAGAYLLLNLISLGMAIYNVCTLFIKLPKRYNKIKVE